jgi:metal-responsive CopG/Arc/MetJ family transcriptional regulator
LKAVQITLDEELVTAVDRAAKKLGSTRSAFAREALRQELKRMEVRTLEERQRKGYVRRPARPAEFDVWEHEQVWPDPRREDSQRSSVVSAPPW